MEQSRITFQADEQELVKTSGIDKYASHIVNYVEAEFTLGTNWTGFDSVRAMWKSGNETIATVLDNEGKCTVPHELLETRGELKVNLVGSIVENGELTDRLTTFPIIALIVTKIAQVEGDETAPVTPSQFEQFVEIVHQDAVDAYDAKLDAETAQNYAETAQGKAEDAQAGAEQAETNATAQALKSEGYATGRQNGQYVSSDSPYYHNNAQYFKEQAEIAEQGAESAKQAIEDLSVTASVDDNVGTPSVTVTKSTVSGHENIDLAFKNLKAFSPDVEVTPITGGHEVTITDKDGEHSFDVMDGEVSKAFLYSFLPTDTESGAIASFDDGANNVPMLSLVADINPIQDLHGQSSPYPAGGGKNKFGPNTNPTIGVYLNAQGNFGIDVNWLVSGYIEVLPSTTYYFNPNSVQGQVGFAWFYDENKEGISYVNSGPVAFTTPTNAKYMRFSYRNNSSDIQLEIGTTATPYAPYSNICPISGRTEVTVERTGKNLFDKNAITPNSWIKLNTTDIEAQNGYFVSDYIPVTVGTPIISTPRGASRCAYYDKNKNPISYVAWSNGVLNPAYDGYIRVTSGNANIDTLQIEVGSTATVYSPSSAVTITTQLGQTVYGGTLDVVSGVLVIDRAKVDMGDMNWQYTGSYFYSTSLPDLKKGYASGSSAPFVCSVYGTGGVGTSYTADKQIGTDVSNGVSNQTIVVKDADYTDKTTFTTAVTGQTLVYPLATPITIQLTPTEVRTLLGTNNVWADSGDVEVTYKADIQKYIDKQISAVLNA